MVYASTTLSLATLEMLVHVDVEDLPSDLVAIEIAVAKGARFERIHVKDLPRDWAELPGHPACRKIGDGWAMARESLVLRVPSAVVPEEENTLVNPAHPDAATLRVVSTRLFRLDRRLIP